MEEKLMPLDIIVRLERIINGIINSKSLVRTEMFLDASQIYLKEALDAGFPTELVRDYLNRVTLAANKSYDTAA